MMNIALGIVAFILGITLLSSLAVNVYSQRLLSKCIDLLDAVMEGDPIKGTE